MLKRKPKTVSEIRQENFRKEGIIDYIRIFGIEYHRVMHTLTAESTEETRDDTMNHHGNPPPSF